MFKVEKIKVAGWTYMAACGLDLARSENVNTQTSFRNSSLLPNGRRSHYNNDNGGKLTLLVLGHLHLSVLFFEAPVLF